MTTFIVSGVWRSGTTMMTRALAAGGDIPLLPLADDVAIRQERIHAKAGYDPQPEGFLETNTIGLQADRSGWWHHLQDGHLFKMSPHGLFRLLPADYRIVYMHRELAELERSWWDTFNNPFSEPELWMGEDAVAILRQRRDVVVHEVQYAEAVTDPLGTFVRLRDEGWPLDPEKAAAVVDPALYRHR